MKINTYEKLILFNGKMHKNMNTDTNKLCKKTYQFNANDSRPSEEIEGLHPLQFQV